MSLKFALEAGFFLYPRLLQKRGWLQLMENVFYRSLSRRNSHIGECSHRLHLYVTALRKMVLLIRESYQPRKLRAARVHMIHVSFVRFTKRLLHLKWYRFCRKRSNVIEAKRTFKTMKYWISLRSNSRVNAWVADCRRKDHWFSRWYQTIRNELIDRNNIRRAEYGYSYIKIKPTMLRWISYVSSAQRNRRLELRQIGNRTLCQWLAWMSPMREQRVAEKYAHRCYSFKWYRAVIKTLLNHTLNRKRMRNAFLTFRKLFPDISRRYNHIGAFSSNISYFKEPRRLHNPAEVITSLCNGFHGLLQIFLQGVRRWDRFEEAIVSKLTASVKFTRTYTCVSAALVAVHVNNENYVQTSFQKFRSYAALYLVSKCFFAWKVCLGCFATPVDIMHGSELREYFPPTTDVISRVQSHSLLTKFYWIRKSCDLIRLESILRHWSIIYSYRTSNRLRKLLYALLKSIMRWGFFLFKKKVQVRRDTENLRSTHIKALKAGTICTQQSAEIAGLIVKNSPMTWGRSRSMDAIYTIENVPSPKDLNLRGLSDFNEDHGGEGLLRQTSPFVIRQSQRTPRVRRSSHQSVHLFKNEASITPLADSRLQRTPLATKRPKLVGSITRHDKELGVSPESSNLNKKRPSFGNAERPAELSPIFKPPALPCDISPSFYPSNVSMSPESGFFESSVSESLLITDSAGTPRRRLASADVLTKVRSSPLAPQTIDHPSVNIHMRRGYHSEYLNRKVGTLSPPPAPRK